MGSGVSCRVLIVDDPDAVPELLVGLAGVLVGFRAVDPTVIRSSSRDDVHLVQHLILLVLFYPQVRIASAGGQWWPTTLRS